MNSFIDNPLSLEEHIAVVTSTCLQCDNDIDIGDTCYVDTSDGMEEGQAKIFCQTCAEAWWDTYYNSWDAEE